MKYNIGDKVRIKSLDWYKQGKEKYCRSGDIYLDGTWFYSHMSNKCGCIMIVKSVNNGYYRLEGSNDNWTDEMIEGLVEKGTLIERVDDNGLPFNEWLSHKGAFHVPDDYVLKDENGNKILTSKIILEKKKQKYPTTYVECYEVMYGKKSPFHSPQVVKNIGYKGDLFTNLQRLIFYRDAYWKIAGEEMGFDKPWEPDWRKARYIIYRNQDNIIGGYREAGHVEHHIFEFPSKEMRDAFKENFDPDIEICKEFL